MSKEKTKKSLQNMPKAKRKRYKAFLECSKLWPNVFNLERPLPLAIGIKQMLVDDAVKRELTVSSSSIYKALQWHTATYQYKKCVSELPFRYDINSRPAGKVTSEQKSHALLEIEKATEGAAEAALRIEEKLQKEKAKKRKR